MIACYILYSVILDKYYVGFTQESVISRLEKHNNSFYDEAFTTITNDWIVYLVIACEDISQAIKIERHIKKMKSKTYIENLLIYPEMQERLLLKFSSIN